MRRFIDTTGRRCTRTQRPAISADTGIAAANMPATNDGFYYDVLGSETKLIGGSTAASMACVFRLNALPASNQGLVGIGRTSSAISLTRGYMLYNQNTNNTRGALKLSGSGTTYTPANFFVAGDVGKIHRLVITYDGTTYRLYKNGAQVGTGTAAAGTLDKAVTSDKLFVGYSFPTASTNAYNVDIIGIAFDNTVISGANVATWDAAVQTDPDGMVELVSGCRWWKAASWDGSTGTSVWDDETATYSLSTLSTSENKISITSPVWGS